MSRPERTNGDPGRGTRVHRSRQAEAVASVLERLPGFCSAQQIHAELRDRGEPVGLTTVYRHLQVLSENGRIDAIRDSSGEILYRRCQTDAHHHHLTCRNCGRSVEVEERAVEHWAEQVGQQAGFTDVGHTVELFGYCPDCSAPQGLPPRQSSRESGRRDHSRTPIPRPGSHADENGRGRGGGRAARSLG